MNPVETRLRVRYAETDQMGIVYYANYLVWMEVGRVEWCKAQGFNYRDMERDDGAFLVVAEAECRYLAPAAFDDDVVIETRVVESRARSIRFGYRMLHAGPDGRPGRLLATGSTNHIICGANRRPMRLPEKYRRYFQVE
ncbi:MAG TPA: thioesterase family protein [Bryobacterales bacterium]|nr:thioesterase family protein [Bryobacterales bacterium]